MRRALPVLLVGAIGAVAACTLTTDLSGLSGGAPAPIEGGVDGSVMDASSDVVVGPVRDAAPADGPDAMPLGFCASHAGHAVCIDFDEGDPASLGWDQTVTLGSVSVSTTRSVSAPRALFATIPRRPAGDKENATLHRTFAGPFKHVVLEFDMYMEPPDWQTGDINTGIADIDLFGKATNTGITISAGQSYITMGTPGIDNQVNMPIPFGTWFHTRLDFDPAGIMRATIGPYVVTQPFAAVPSDTNPSMLVNIGINGYNAPAPTFSAYYDNVTIDFP